MKYIIHLKLDYDPPKKENKSEKDINIKKLADAIKKSFLKDADLLLKQKQISLLNEEYKGPTFGTTIVIDINDKVIEQTIDSIRKIKVVELIEMVFK